MSRADRIFIDMCKDILENGVSTEGEKVRPHWEDGSSAYTIKKFGVVNRYDLSEEFPAITLRKTAIKSCTDEMLWIWQKKSNNIKDLNSHIWDEWADENGSIGKAYGYQLGVKHQYKEGMMDQVDRVIYDLKNNPFSSWTFTIEPRKLLVSVADVVIDRGDAMPALTVRVDGFADGEDENSITGFQKPTAKVKGTVNTNDTNVKNFEVTYSGGKATANYQFVENTIAKITINSTDTTAPEITGVTDGKTYCSKVTVTVTDKDLDTVKLDGKKVTLKDDKFTVSPKSGKQKIEAVDKAGNRTTVSITVNNGHTKSDWIIDKLPTSTKEGSRHKECTVCGTVVDSASIPKLTPSNPENPTKPDPENPTKPDPEKPTNPEKPTQKKYKVIEGADVTYTINKDGNLTMRADSKYKNFKGIEIDGKTVDSKNYTAWSGSTYVKFKKDFVNTLSVGKHTVKFKFTDGYATTSLTIAKKDNSDTKNPSDNKKPDTNTNTSGNGTNNTTTTANTQVKAPKTGDTFQPILWAGILCVSVAGMAGVVAADKKRKKCQ